MLKIELGKYYKARDGELVMISDKLDPTDHVYQHGFRYKGHNKSTYKENGQWSFVDKKKTDHDLVEEVNGEA